MFIIIYKNNKYNMENSKLVENIKKLDAPGRDKFKKLCYKLGYEFGEPTNEKLAYDCFFKYKGKVYLVELKDRKPEYEKYDELILEVDKYNRVMNWKERLNAAGCYYVQWFGNTAYIFNLEEDYITQHQERKIMNRVTAASTTDKCFKDVYLVNKKNAKKFEL